MPSKPPHRLASRPPAASSRHLLLTGSDLEDPLPNLGVHVPTEEGIRESLRLYAALNATNDYPATITRLHVHYEQWNAEYFDGLLPPNPFIAISVPPKSTQEGWYRDENCFGGRHEIGISASLLFADCSYISRGDATEHGFQKYIDDIFLHEVVHLHRRQSPDQESSSYKGHGKLFTAECNRIGSLLGLPKVRAYKDRRKGTDTSMPLASQWPACVRPIDYYEGAYTPIEVEKPSRPETFPDESKLALDYLRRVIERCDPNDQGMKTIGQAAIVAIRIWQDDQMSLGRYPGDIPFSQFMGI